MTFDAFTAMKRIQMNEPTITPTARHAVESSTANLFMWRGNGIVLIGTREDDRWVLARAWLEDDRLQHVRRWSFTQPISYSRQVRRLIMEATGNVVLARDEAVHALAWAEAAS
jgi:hypothetical protein